MAPVKELDGAIKAYGYSNDVLRRAKEHLKDIGALKIARDREYQGGFIAKLLGMGNSQSSVQNN